MDKTLLLVKPDGVARGLVGRILTRIEEKGLFIAGLRLLRLEGKSARRMYGVHEGKHFYEPLIRYITAGPIVAVVIEGKGAVEMIRALAGPTFGSAASPGTLRGDFAVSNRYNIVHASDSAESFEREWPIFFAAGDIQPLDVARVKWIYDDTTGEVI